MKLFFDLMCPLNRHHWQRVNRLALMIHATGCRSDVIALAVGDLPKTLDARHSCWTEVCESTDRQLVHTSPGFMETHHSIAIRPFIRNDHALTLSIHHEQPFSQEQRAMFKALGGHFELACSRLLLRAPLRTNLALTRREQEILPYLLDGRTNPDIAVILGISPRTVEKHVAAILEKSGVDNRRLLVGADFVNPLGPAPAKNG